MKRFAAGLCALLVVISCAAVAHANTGLVYNGRLDGYPGHTLGEMFDAYFTNASWRQGVGTDGYTYVSITGTASYNKQPAQVTIQFRILSGDRFEVNAFERDGRGRAWSEFHNLMETIYLNYDMVQANRENVEYQDPPAATPAPDNGCSWCEEWWCEGEYCENTDAWRDNDYEEHAFWGISSGDSVRVADVLKERNIEYEETSGSRLSSYDSKEGQDVTMFGLPVSLHFSYSCTRPNWLMYADISTNAGDVDEAIAAYETMLKAVEAQYGEPTGGYLANAYSDRSSMMWNYPTTDGQVDYDTVNAVLEKAGFVRLCTYHNNLGVILYMWDQEDDEFYANVRMRYHYNLPARGDEYTPPSSADFFTFTRPGGNYGAASSPIELTF